MRRIVYVSAFTLILWATTASGQTLRIYQIDVEQADAALLAAKNPITAAILKYRLDTGSPPFFQTGTCRAARIAERAGR
jgi:hypothetical protein